MPAADRRPPGDRLGDQGRPARLDRVRVDLRHRRRGRPQVGEVRQRRRALSDDDHRRDRRGRRRRRPARGGDRRRPRGKTPVYVLGSSALFGRVDGVHELHRPQDQADLSTTCRSARGPRASCSKASACRSGTTARNTTSSTPASAPGALEAGRGDRGDLFRHPAGRPPDQFDPAGMREYRPDWVSREQYDAGVNKHPIRQAVMKAARDRPAEPPRPALAQLPGRRRPRLQGGDGQEPGAGRPDRLHRRRGPGADRRRDQEARPRDVAALAGAL